MTLLSSARSPAKRRGFTLIELLVVMGIIAALAALSIGAYQRVRTSRDNANTEVILQKVGSALDRQIRAVADNAPRGDKMPADMLGLASNDPIRARALMTKYLIKREFPVSAADTQSTPFTAGFLGFNQAKNMFQGISGTTNAYDLSAALLLRSLSQGHSGVLFNPDDVGANGVKTLPGSSERVFVDAWGNPLYLARWVGDPTYPAGALAELDSLFKMQDPVDPENKFNTGTWPQKAQVQTDLGTQLDNHHYLPFVVSDGPDGRPNTGDEMFSFRVRAVGKKGN